MDVNRTPSEHELTVEHSIICPVDGCNKQFKSSSCLLMHKLRRHEKRTLEKSAKEGKMLYFCPEETCQRNEKNGSKPFPRLGQLKQVIFEGISKIVYRLRIKVLRDTCRVLPTAFL